jgi:parvulin-like peptidyl-prolyl isomerase
MTFRTRSAPQNTRRRTRRSDTRRAIYITITFSIAIIVALAMLGGVFAAGYYTAHWAPIAGVNGQAISSDDVFARAKVNLARYQREDADYATLRNQGKITSDEYTNFQSTIASQESSVMTDAITELENELGIRQYAAKNGITVTSQQVDDQIKKDGTIAEMRHVKIIGVAPDPIPPAYSIDAADEQRAQTKAQGYLDEVKAGKSWSDVSTEATDSTDNTSGQVSDAGLVRITDLPNLDPDFRQAIFDLQNVNDVTALFKGTDGVYRFATVTEIVPEFVDTNWESSVANASSGDAYRRQAEGEAIKAAVQKSIEDKYIYGATTQRNVLELSVSPGYGQPGDGDEVEIRIMVFAPNHSMSAASGVDPSDPAWTDAKNRADAAYATLQADPSKFDSMARDTSNNDDIYFASNGGQLPWIPADLFMATTQSGSTGLGMPSVQAAVFANDVTPDEILPPIFEQSSGYVVVQFQGRRPAPEVRIAQAQFDINSGEDFATVAQAISEKVNAADGAKLGWVAPYQLGDAEENAIFAVPVGSVTPMIDDSGYHIYKVIEQQTRVPDAAEQARLKDVVFPRWLADLQASALIWTDDTRVADLQSATP